MPVPQIINFFLVEWAPRSVPKRIIQNSATSQFNLTILKPLPRTGKMPVPQRMNFFRGTGILPVPKTGN